MTTDTFGIKISSVGLQVRPQWKSLVLGLADLVGTGMLAAATQGFAASTPGLLKSAIATLKTVDVNDAAETKAFALISLSLGHAIDRLAPRTGSPTPMLQIIGGNDLVEKIRSATESGGYYLDETFFSNPIKNGLYQFLRADLVTLLCKARSVSFADHSQEIGAKLDGAFNSSVYYVWREKPEYFNSLTIALTGPGSESARREFEWFRYRSDLVDRFRVDPVFGQNDAKISVSEIYVAPRASWADAPDAGGKRHIVDLHSEIGKWIDGRDTADPIRLIFGGPGSGKSTFARALAHDLALRQDHRPLLVELQGETGVSQGIASLIDKRFVGLHASFHSSPLAHNDSQRPLVLIFDGLDELVIPGGGAANRVADAFVSAVNAFLFSQDVSLRGSTKIIVTGRTTIMQSFKQSHGVREDGALEILGFVYSDEDGRQVDRRGEWWDKYSDAYREPKNLPEAFEAQSLTDVMSEPLLCFLLARSGFLGRRWKEAEKNIDVVYRQLFIDVWERKWGSLSRGGGYGKVGPTSALLRADFDILMEAMGLAAWWGGASRIATKQLLDRALDVVGARSAWEKFKDSGGYDLEDLALTFYFKQSHQDAQGIEFTHKTFAEYLVARFLLRTVMGRIGKAVARIEEPISLQEAATRWMEVGIHTFADRGIASFLWNEARFEKPQNLTEAIRGTVAVFSECLRNGLPAMVGDKDHFRGLERRNRFALANLLACLEAMIRALNEATEGTGKISLLEVEWFGDATAPARLLGRLLDWQGPEVSSQIDMSFIRFPEGMLLAGATLENSQVIGAFADSAIIRYSNFKRSRLIGTTFHGSSFSGCTFVGADLRFADLRACTLEGVDLSYATMTGTKLDYTVLNGVVLEGAIMDHGWWDKVDLGTLSGRGLPVLVLDGRSMAPGDPGYSLPERVRARLIQ